MFWSIKNSTEVLDKLKSRGFRESSLSTYDFSPHSLIKKKLINLIETTFQREGTLYLACNDKIAFFNSNDQKRFKLWSGQNVREVTFSFDLILSYTDKL